jgi:hypothetical protein
MHSTRFAADDNPIKLKIVAIIFLVEGLFGTFDTTFTMIRDIDSGIFPIHVNLMLIGFPVCFGLLKNKNSWRITGTVVSWLQIVFMSIILTLLVIQLAGFSYMLPANMQIQFEIWLVRGPLGAGFIALIGLIIAIWKYQILRIPEIRKLFQ